MTRAIGLKEAGKLLGIGPITLGRYLRERGIFQSDGNMRNTPRSEYIKDGFFTCELVQYRTGPVVHFHNKPMVTPTGLVFIEELLRGSGVATKKQVAPGKHCRIPDQQTDRDYRSEVLRLAGVEETKHPADRRLRHGR